MTPAIQEQLKATGRAQVIVVLGSARLGRAFEESATHVPVAPTPAKKQRVRESARELSRFFIADAATRAGALEAAYPEAAQPPLPAVYENLGVLLGTTDRDGVRALAADNQVAVVTAAPEFSLIRPVSRSAQSRQGTFWGLKRLGIPALWEQGYTGRDVLIGHLDTGVDARHPALKGAIAEFAEFDWLGRRIPGATAHDPDGHGTHTAGTLVGRKVGARQFGIASEARLASALVIEGGNVIARILGGLDWLVGFQVRVIALSLGLRGYRPDFLPIISILRARQILPIIAVGNEGPGSSRSPGNYAEVLSVGACDQADEVALFSSSQRFRRRHNPMVPSLVAPGVDVFSCVPGRRYAEYSGSSMATPHVARLAALLFGAHPKATADQVEGAIFDSCTLPAGMPPERANRGIPDGPTALAKLCTALGLLPPSGSGVSNETKTTSRQRSGRSDRPSPKTRRRPR